jgi:hypothetical protein
MRRQRGTKRSYSHEHSLREIALQAISDHKNALDEVVHINMSYIDSIHKSNKIIVESNLIGTLFVFMLYNAKKEKEEYIITRAITFRAKGAFEDNNAAQKMLRAFASCARIKRRYTEIKRQRDEAITFRDQQKEAFEIAKNYETQLRQIAQNACDRANNIVN